MKTLFFLINLVFTSFLGIAADNCCQREFKIGEIQDISKSQKLHFLNPEISMIPRTAFESAISNIISRESVTDCPLILEFRTVNFSRKSIDYIFNIYVDFTPDSDISQRDSVESLADIGKWEVKVELLNLRLNDLVKEEKIEWHGTFGGKNSKDGHTKGFDKLTEVMGKFTPLDDIIYKFESKPLSAKISSEKEKISTGEEMMITLENIRGEYDKAKPWQYLIIGVREGSILNGTPIEDNRVVSISVSDIEEKGIHYKAPDDCDIAEDIIRIYNTCEYLKEKCLICNINTIVAEYKIEIEPFCGEWIYEIIVNTYSKTESIPTTTESKNTTISKDYLTVNKDGSLEGYGNCITYNKTTYDNQEYINGYKQIYKSQISGSIIENINNEPTYSVKINLKIKGKYRYFLHMDDHKEQLIFYDGYEGKKDEIIGKIVLTEYSKDSTIYYKEENGVKMRSLYTVNIRHNNDKEENHSSDVPESTFKKMGKGVLKNLIPSASRGIVDQEMAEEIVETIFKQKNYENQ